jgi:hypothetical protein
MLLPEMAIPEQAPAQKKGEAHCWASPVVRLVEPPYGVRMVMVVVPSGACGKLLMLKFPGQSN